MPLYRALELCPQLTVVRPEFPRYREASDRVFAIFEEGAAAVEGLSLDEAFVSLPGVSLDEAIAFAENVRARVRAEVGLTCSAGVASVKMVAKIASDANKPDVSRSYRWERKRRSRAAARRSTVGHRAEDAAAR